ncbi:MAG: ArsR family transcriptional regulator [Ponticaulis sp.]|nr:ArsR family transcriptional regulator [Ponticaulis sp.]
MDMTFLQESGFQDRAETASEFLKAMANSSRLLILCQIGEGELSVGELQELVGLSQSAMSQHLAKLREQKLVASRREAQTIYYRLSDPTVVEIISALARRFCPELEQGGSKC